MDDEQQNRQDDMNGVQDRRTSKHVIMRFYREFRIDLRMYSIVIQSQTTSLLLLLNLNLAENAL
jgi:hypothetical protein